MKKTMRNTALVGLSALAIAGCNPQADWQKDVNRDGLDDVQITSCFPCTSYVLLSVKDSGYKKLFLERAYVSQDSTEVYVFDNSGKIKKLETAKK